ncbi:hypothetical protein HCA73_10525 [Listeria booriae]|uniref:phage tail terminator protein n=1 Tax=Listeria booriae TaxID=1552123 RepID=UPI001627B80F|nr:minor capsid protein [Listeria booriae]MBC1913084.1 hypothetical protein [Listeria booriae]
MPRLDFADCMLSAIKKNVDLTLKTTTIGTLGESDSLAFTLTPTGKERMYMDGSKVKTYAFQMKAKSKNQETCVDDLNSIVDYVSCLEIDSVQSKNDSFTIDAKRNTSVPSLVTHDEQGYYIYSASFEVDLLILGGK